MNETRIQKSNADVYFRSSVAIRHDHKAILLERMKQLGLKTTGDIMNMLATADDSVVEALKPYADKFVPYRDRNKEQTQKAKFLAQLKKMDVAILNEIISQYKDKSAMPAVQ